MTLRANPGRKKYQRLITNILGLVVALTCSGRAAADRNGLLEVPSLQTFFISSVLQRPDNSAEIKLVHSLEVARSSTEAEQHFLEQMVRDFPDYLVVTTLTTPATAAKSTPAINKSVSVNI